MQPHPTPNRHDGFTLIELLVVIVILVALAAIAVPIFLNQKSKADNAAAQSLTTNLSNALSAGIGTGDLTITNNDGTAPLTGVITVGDSGGGDVAKQSIPVAGSTIYVNLTTSQFCVSVQSDSGNWYKYSTATPVVVLAAECTSAAD